MIMKKKYYIGLDQGTTGTTTLLSLIHILTRIFDTVCRPHAKAAGAVLRGSLLPASRILGSLR